VPVQPRDAREASDVFYKQGRGDALLNYENEVIFTNRQYPPAERLPYVVPAHNIRVTPVSHMQMQHA
jgi:sulfate transport system substrate-binding protein